MYRLPLEVGCLCWYIWYLFGEMSNINAAREQYYKHKFTSRRLNAAPGVTKCCGATSCYRICSEGTGICLSSGWDCFDISTAIISMGVIVLTWALPYFIPLFTSQHDQVVSVCVLVADVCLCCPDFFLEQTATLYRCVNALKVAIVLPQDD